MYEQYYGFNAKPFDQSTNVENYYIGQSQKSVLNRVQEGLTKGGGFIVLTGLTGIGKSSLIEFLKSRQASLGLMIASISGEKIDDLGLLPSILSSFNRNVTDYKLPALIAQIESYIHLQIDQGKKPILIVDEAQHLSYRSLEVLRLLSNFQSEGHPSFQVILVGNSHLTEMLSDQAHSALHQQIVSSAEISPMSLDETKNYVLHHLKRVGWSNNPVLTDEIFVQAQQATSGIPSEVNEYFDHLLKQEMINRNENSFVNQKSRVAQKSNKIESASIAMDSSIHQSPLSSGSTVSAENVSKIDLAQLNNSELLAVINQLEKKNAVAQQGLSADETPRAASEVNESIPVMTTEIPTRNTNRGNDSNPFDDGFSIEETKRAFEGSAGGSAKKGKNGHSQKSGHAWFNWHVAGVVLGSYFLSAVIAGSYYYIDVSGMMSDNKQVIMAESG